MTDFFENLLSNGELQEKVAELQGKIDAYQMSENEANEIIAELKAENDSLKEENYQLQKDCQICENFIDFIPCKPIRDMDYDLQKVINQRDNYYQTLQKIKGVVTALYMNNWLQMNETARKSIQLLQELITKVEE